MPKRPWLRSVRSTALAAVAVTAAVVAGAAPPAAAAAPTAAATATAETPRLRVLSYNAFLFSKNLYPNWGQDHRAAEIPRTDFFRGNDVVVLQEAFDNSSSDALLAAAAEDYPHRTPVLGRSRGGWDATGGAYSSFTPEDGGVTVLSTWPIVRKEQYVYAEGCGSDWYSNKGFVYTELDVDGTPVHVVGTHAQSTDPGCGEGEAARVRSSQFEELDAFLDARRIPAGEQVIVAGDFNVDSHSSEYPTMLADADLVDADGRSGPAYSFDPRRNSIAADRYPGEAREHLDHVLHRAGHARPAQWHNETVDERSAPWTVTSWGTSYTYTNLSDHYPVIGY
ncbi:sphingomyelin phosphodiesterase [Streptomyces chumphonensis]|uniref:Sphingomyelin phosphodiesterase n=1 Tax=Streptomyces chumphonensis TaxID=1214925 RepID=A0A927EWE3_9ACTN|nr:sphingomyelin phosphodiesterase [Streptomyces chumphonensis]MBD3931225.1 sphingomyelin phosphodiesterase [Streptomyces chumphonensis]